MTPNLPASGPHPPNPPEPSTPPRVSWSRPRTPAPHDVLGALSTRKPRPDNDPGQEEEPRLGALLTEILDAIMSIQDADFGSVSLQHPERGTLELAVERNLFEGSPDRSRALRPHEARAASLCIETRSRVVIEDVERDERYAQHRAFASAEGYRSVMATPMVSSDGTPLGAVSTMFVLPHAPSERELQLTDHYVRHAVRLIERHLTATKLREAKAAAERASEGKSRFLALVSHELRTPISAILGYAHLLLDGIPEPIGFQASDHVQRIAACADYLTEVIDQVLEYSRLEAGQDTVHVTRVRLRDVVADVAAVVEPLADRKGLRLRLRTADAPETFETDDRRLRQILLNLLGNAVKFTDAGEVSLTVERSADRILFHVADDGCGIAPDVLEAVFEPFVQGERPPRSGRRGSGLGLAIARMFARGMGGELTAVSQPGRGSRFTLWLPAG